ncbi:MAG: protein-export chaperone SecB [Alphaproteobacteria bacterium]|nr:protein-export chaperone SecB [Alphaproteobacteria bacterium]
MNDNTPTGEVSINMQYIKDFSLEIPHAPQIFSKLAIQPQINVDLNIDANKLDSDNFEVALNLRINANIENEPLFILELSYAAACTVKIPEEQKEPLLYIEIPKLLFPFARQIISSNIANAGLPPLMLTPVDFAAVYQAKKQQQASAKAN